MLLSQMPHILTGVGLALDIIGFSILFFLAIPALMRRNFVATDRVGLDGANVDSDHGKRLMDPERAELLGQRRQRQQTCWYWAGGLAVLAGFILQLIALLVP